MFYFIEMIVMMMMMMMMMTDLWANCLKTRISSKPYAWPTNMGLVFTSHCPDNK